MKIRHYITTHECNAGDHCGHYVKLADPSEAEFSFLADEEVNPLDAHTDFGNHYYISIKGRQYRLKSENK